MRRRQRSGARVYPWGDGAAAADHGVFDFVSWDPAAGRQPSGGRERMGRRGSGRQRLGVDEHDRSRPFPGFRAMASYPEYSADFFDGEHFVMKGASPATARELLRPTFRNWFRGRYPYVYATFRCVE